MSAPVRARWIATGLLLGMVPFTALGFALGSVLRGHGAAWRAMALPPPGGSLKPGDEATLRGETADSSVTVAWNTIGHVLYYRAVEAKDPEGALEQRAKGEVADVEGGTKVRVLDDLGTNEPAGYSVRLLSGPYSGETAFVAGRFVVPPGQ